MTNHANSQRRWTPGQITLVSGRLLLGTAFIYLGIMKMLDPVEFLKQAHAYGYVQEPPLLNVIAVTLPWVEIVCGVALILGIALRGTGLLMFGMLVAFTAAVTIRGLDIAQTENQPLCVVKFDCGCGTGEVYVCHKMAENSVMTFLALLPVIWPNQRLSLGRARSRG